MDSGNSQKIKVPDELWAERVSTALAEMLWSIFEDEIKQESQEKKE